VLSYVCARADHNTETLKISAAVGLDGAEPRPSRYLSRGPWQSMVFVAGDALTTTDLYKKVIKIRTSVTSLLHIRV